MQPIKSGKVRELYDAGENLVLVASDRVSAFDVILPTPIPEKGKILSTLAVFWFARTSHIIDNHLLLHRVSDFPRELADFGAQNDWEGRAILCRKARVLPVECVVRGYLSGSGWKSYRENGEVCGVKLPPNLRESQKLPSPIFTPTTKADAGHDEPIDWAQTIEILGQENAEKVRDVSLALYEFIHDFAAQKGLIFADTKFEFGVDDQGQIILIDEIATPDSSRYWDAAKYEIGRGQDSFDKQFVRDYLETLDWPKTPPGPELPPEVVQKTKAKYVEAYDRITGLNWPQNDVRAAFSGG